LQLLDGVMFHQKACYSPHNVSQFCNDALSNASRVVGEYINNYDILLDECYPSLVEQELRLWKAVRVFLFEKQFGYDCSTDFFT
jgi:serine carboxypeptidase-like clade 2